MSISKVSYELVRGIESLNNMFQQIEHVLDEIPILYKKSFGQEWLGYYVHIDHNKRKDGWVGNYYNGSFLVFEYHNKTAHNALKNNSHEGLVLSDDKRHYISYFKFEGERFFA